MSPQRLSCMACGRETADTRMRLVHLEAESAVTGEPLGTVTVEGTAVPARYGHEPRCGDCWARYRVERDRRGAA
jgi:hypothetical protein